MPEFDDYLKQSLNAQDLAALRDYCKTGCPGDLSSALTELRLIKRDRMTRSVQLTALATELLHKNGLLD